MNIVEKEAAIIQQFQRGESTAVRYIYNSYYQPLCFFAEKMLGNQFEAQDIAIESILKLLEKRTRFDSLSRINSFLHITVRNACVDALRATQRRQLSYREILYLAGSGEDTGNAEKERRDIVHEIYRQVERLPPQCREIFKQLYYKRKSAARVARRLGISPQTVLNQKGKAIRLLRTALLEKELIEV